MKNKKKKMSRRDLLKAGAAVTAGTLAAQNSRSFAAGSDKTGTVDVDEVVYINGFMDCIGLNALENEHEYIFQTDILKEYFNFSDPGAGEPAFTYNPKDVYDLRYLRIVTIHPDGTWTEEFTSVWDAMTDRGLFTARWGQMGSLTPVELFAMAVDDAVQVLDFIHGDSNIEFLPDYEP